MITLESDKSNVEVPSTEDGVIEKINVTVGDKVSKGDLILSIKAQNGEKKSTLPPATEKIIVEAEKTLKKTNINETQNNTQKSNFSKNLEKPKKENRIKLWGWR